MLAGLAISFFLLGLILVRLALKQKKGGKLRKFLVLTGASAAGFFVGVVLHNLLYALALAASHLPLVSYLAEALHVAFFIIAIFICPLGFLIGVMGVFWSFISKIRENKG